MNLLLDTCTLIWLDGNVANLSPTAKQVIADPSNRIFLSSISAWEIAQKQKNGKLELWDSCAEFLGSLTQDYDMEPLPFQQEDAVTLADIDRLHKDPFDLMLICQAKNHNLILVTPDPSIRQYPIPVLW